LIHAIIDAILGAAALGDIGSHFPDTDQRWENADSAKLLESVVDEVAEAGYVLGNIDVTVVCEKPKIRPYADVMRAKLADILRISVGSVSIKGKTNEGMGAIGEGQGIAAYAVVLIDENKN
jgi:2-C-methyl-D-erythritol 2,4-cyclodiphosphate synthase